MVPQKVRRACIPFPILPEDPTAAAHRTVGREGQEKIVLGNDLGKNIQTLPNAHARDKPSSTLAGRDLTAGI